MYKGLTEDKRHKMIMRIESVSTKTWPAAVCENIGGWLFRHEPEVSYRRCNSAFAGYEQVTLDLPDLLREVHARYLRTGRKALIHATEISQPEGLLRRLKSNQHVRADIQADVMIHKGVPQPIAVADDVNQKEGVHRDGERDDVIVRFISAGDSLEIERFLIPYADAFDKQPESLGDYARFMSRLQSDAKADLLVLETAESVPIGCGIGVFCEGTYGLFGMGIMGNQRGKGYGNKMMEALHDRGEQYGADLFYLQVTRGNRATRLYERVGYKTLYTYSYFEVLSTQPK